MAESTKPAKAALPKEVFGVDVPNHELLKLAYDAFLANSRQASATTKTRGEVRGGGKKPWKQKGTGRARFGSTRNPIWRHGGIVFGPRGNENYKLKLSKTSKRVAIRQALTLANEAKKITVSDIKTTGKTAEIAKFIADKKFKRDRRVLLVVDEKTPELIRATNNLQSALLVRAQYLSVYYVLNADQIIMTPAAVKVVDAWLNPKEDK
ncbi:50S ribosomal protein L4 [Candidatus Southlakia epibionticum]|uniref:Large ribosomal subunit protein uL4 n=1 Tax=Candidatus Southlakia epibionticum TaxID=3043284 RepID=A0ABY8WUX8_9BACT|nr:50S ribosomal protein L4 [Candidatus Saccharimonadaceae bacterium ML1]